MKMKQGLHETFYSDGSIHIQEWYKKDKLHRLDGPAYISYYKDGSIYYQEWYKDIKFHR